ncbi:MAG: hypothetical protein ABSE49_05685 [Polyangiaceae bacterium]|jgi:hypothetical protein
MRTGWSVGARAALCATVLGGCAAGPSPEPAVSAPAVTGAKEESREPATIEEAQAQLERARAQLAGPSPEKGPAAAGGAPVPVTTESAPAGATQSAESPPGPRCGNACTAMSSMRRAVDAICRLAGETDARCTDARRTAKESEAKVAGCGCPPT